MGMKHCRYNLYLKKASLKLSKNLPQTRKKNKESISKDIPAKSIKNFAICYCEKLK